VHFVATDAHNTSRRPPRARAALAALSDIAGEDIADALTVRNPLAVLENRALEYDPEPVAPASGGLLTRLRGFFGRKGPTI
jgi:protein-tyrosine phosphatase